MGAVLSFGVPSGVVVVVDCDTTMILGPLEKVLEEEREALPTELEEIKLVVCGFWEVYIGNTPDDMVDGVVTGSLAGPGSTEVC